MVIRELLKEFSTRIPETDAQELVAFVLGTSRSLLRLRQEEPLTDAQEARLRELVSRRLAGEPLQYILGEWDFYGRTFAVAPQVLIPRADTECLIDAALSLPLVGDELLDLCTGSGCIPVTLTLELRGTRALALDISDPALTLAARNAEALRAPVTVQYGNVLEEPAPELLRRFALLTANPPYIRSELIDTLSPEVRREPKEALDGGADGLIFYRAIAHHWKNVLLPGGHLVLEIGYDQAQAVQTILAEAGFCDLHALQDLGGNDRVIIGTLKD